MNTTVDAAWWRRSLEFLRREIRELTIVSAYLYVCFAALTLFKMATLSAYGIDYAPWGFAAIKALVLGKFMLIGSNRGIGSRRVGTNLFHSLVYKVLVFAAFLVVLSVLEEIAVALLHGRPATSAFAHFGTWLQIIASCILLCVILIPWLGLETIGEALGPGGLTRLFFDRRERGDRA